MNPSSHSVPGGFLFGWGSAGIKPSGNPDLAIIEAPLGAAAAATFTRNRVVAAPVVVGREHLRSSRGRVRALLINAGNANCATGEAGLDDARRCCGALARALSVPPPHILPLSTGIIGVPLPVDRLLAAIPSVLQSRSAEGETALGVARAIMTTDTRPKIASAAFDVENRSVRVFGVAKGSGMIHPDMATLLVFILTDLEAPPADLRRVIRDAIDESFNCLSIDGDTSTNDTAVLLASGASGARVRTAAHETAFAKAVTEVCLSLAAQVASDGEGVRHVVTLRVEGAPSRAAADRIARTLANSLLVKTAWAGADPNWGRLLAAVGRSGVAIDPGEIGIWIGGRNVCARGTAVVFDAVDLHRCMSEPAYEIRVQVGRGSGSAQLLTADLTTEYVRINAEYST